jgi:hypothetical protein
MARTDQWVGLNSKAWDIVQDAKNFVVTPVEGAFNEVAGYLHIYHCQNGDIYTEELQEIVWSSGPCYFTRLKKDGVVVPETNWTEEELDAA